MNQGKTIQAFLVGAALCSVAIPSFAEGAPPQRDQATAPNGAGEATVPHSDVNVRGYGLVFNAGEGGGFAMGGMALARFGVFEAGVLAEAGSTVFEYQYMGLGAAGGVVWRSDYGLRLEALATVGAHEYKGKSSFFSSNEGVSGTTPFAGVRLAASYAVSSGPVTFDLGVMGVAETDLKRDVEVTSTGFLGGKTTKTGTLGQTSYGAGLSIGGTFDI